MLGGLQNYQHINMALSTSAQAWSLPVDVESWTTHKSMKLRDVVLPPPGRGEVLVKLHATSLNFR